MATALTPGYIYFLESDDTDNDDWIADHAGDPDLADIANMTEGSEHCKIQIPKNIKVGAHTGIIVTDTGGGGMSYDFRSERKGYQSLLRGLQTSLANAKLIDQFMMSNRHTSGATATFEQYYLVIYFGVNNHWPFTDHNGNQKSYCRGVVTNFSITWLGTSNLTFNVDFNWRSVWQ